MNIQGILQTKTLAHISISSFGTLVNGLLGAIFFILLAKYLGPDQFGLFSVAVASLTLIADIADAGINTGLINFVSRHIQDDKLTAYRYLKLGLETKLLIWLIILPIGWVCTPWICSWLLNKPELIYPIRVMMIGVGGALLFSFATNSLQSLQKFWQWSGLNILSNSLRLILLVGLFLAGTLNLNTVLWLYIGILFFGFVIGLTFLPLSFLKVGQEKTVAKEFFNYNKWIAVFTVLAAFSARLDTFLSARFLSNVQVGIYSIAVQLSSAVPQVVFAVAAAVAPKLASFNSHHQAILYLKKLQLLVIGLAILGTLSFPAAFYFFPWLGTQYSASLGPFIILMIGQLLFLISLPSHQAIFYYFQKPRLFVFLSGFRLLISLGFGLWLIPILGMNGAALTVLIGALADFIIPTFWVIYKFKTSHD